MIRDDAGGDDKGEISFCVIPDVFNRESKVFPKQGYTNEGIEKNTGFPLTTCGNDKRGTGGNDKGGSGGNACPRR